MADALTVRVADAGREFTLSWPGLLAYHRGGALAGALRARAGLSLHQPAA